MAKISILIVSYNYGRFLRQCIESVLGQTCSEELEIVLVDDGSSDETAEVIRAFPMVRYVFQPHSGVAAARNRALREASGDFIAFLDADDIWKKDKLALQLQYLREHPDCEIVFTGYENFLENGVSPDEEWVKQNILFAAKNKTCLPTALFTRNVSLRCGAFDESFQQSEDTEWTSRLRYLGIQPGFLEDKLLMRRLHGQNLTKSRDSRPTEESIAKAFQIIRRNLQLQKKHGSAEEGISVMIPGEHVEEGISDMIDADHANEGISDMMKADHANEGISVLIPAYHAESYIEECINSIKRQQTQLKGLPLEIIVADDGSEDNTPFIAASHGAQVLQLPHKGSAAAKNAALAQAKYEYIFFLDADDRACDNALRDLLQAIQTRKDCMAVFSRAIDFCQNTDDGQSFYDHFSSHSYSGCLTGCSLIRTETFQKTGYFREELQTGETIDWMQRFRDSGLPYAELDIVTLERRIHQTNTGIVNREQEQRDYAQIIREHLKRLTREESIHHNSGL